MVEIVIGLIIGLAAGGALYLVGKREISPLRQEASSLRQELDSVRPTIQEHELARAKSEAQLDERSEALTRLSASHQEELVRAQQLRNELAEAQAALSTSQALHKASRENATTLTKERDTARVELQKRQTELGLARENLSESESTLVATREQVATLTTERDLARENLRGREDELGTAREELERIRSEHEARMDELTKKQGEVDALFKSIATDVARASNEEFRKQATEDFKRQRELAGQELKQQVEPVGQALQHMRQHLTDIEKQRTGAYEGVNKLIEQTQGQIQKLNDETGDLRAILQSSRHRGRWGEAALENLLELAGMRRGSDFQTQVTGEHGAGRADVVVRLPGGKQLIIDSKTPFDKYREALDAPTEAEQSALLKQHADVVLGTAAQLGRDNYQAQFEASLDFVVMWIPTDSILEGATRALPDLIEQAFDRHRVLLATPVTMIALLSGVAAALRQEEQHEQLQQNAQAIQEAGQRLYDGVRRHARVYAELGSAIERLSNKYNDGVGSIQGNLLQGARQMRELGGGVEGSEAEVPSRLTHESRNFTSRELREPEERGEDAVAGFEAESLPSHAEPVEPVVTDQDEGENIVPTNERSDILADSVSLPLDGARVGGEYAPTAQAHEVTQLPGSRGRRRERPQLRREPAEGNRKSAPSAFRLWGETHEVKHWNDILVGVANQIYQRRRGDFLTALSWRGSKGRQYVATAPHQLKQPRRIGESDYWIEVNHSAEKCFERAGLLLEHFGFDGNDLTLVH